MARDIPVLIGLGEMVDMFPVTKQTVYRWRIPARNSLPEPDLVVSGSPLWRLDTILVWAAKRNLEASATVVKRIRKEQGH